MCPVKPCVNSHGTAQMHSGRWYPVLGCSRFQYKLISYVFACSHMKKQRAIQREKITYYHVKLQRLSLSEMHSKHTRILKTDPNCTNYFSANCSRRSKLLQVNKTQTFFAAYIDRNIVQSKHWNDILREARHRNLTYIFTVTCKRALTGWLINVLLY